MKFLKVLIFFLKKLAWRILSYFLKYWYFVDKSVDIFIKFFLDIIVDILFWSTNQILNLSWVFFPYSCWLNLNSSCYIKCRGSYLGKSSLLYRRRKLYWMVLISFLRFIPFLEIKEIHILPDHYNFYFSIF